MADENTTTPKLSSLQDLKRLHQENTEGKLLTLSDSGLTFRVGRPNIGQAIKDGLIPKNLLSVAMKLKMDAQVGQDEANQMIDLIDRIVKLAVIEPNLSDEDLSLIPDIDKIEIMQYVQGGTRGLDSFRKQRGF